MLALSALQNAVRVHQIPRLRWKISSEATSQIQPRLPTRWKCHACHTDAKVSGVLRLSRQATFQTSKCPENTTPATEMDSAPVKVAWHQHWQPKTANHVGKRMPTMVTAASNGVSYGHHMEIKILMATPIANVPAPSGAARKKLMMSAAGCYLKDYPNKTPSPLQPSCLR